MGKKGGWFSAIKRVFIPNSKDKLVNGSEKKNSKEKKKKGLGQLKHGDGRSFIPLFREPSSIEKILGEAESDQNLTNFRPVTPPGQPNVPSNVASPWAPTPQQVASPSRRSTSRRRSSPPRFSPQRVASPPRRSTSRRRSSPPRFSPPQRVASPPRRSTSRRRSSPPRFSPPQRIASPPRRSTSQRRSSPPRVSPPQRVASPSTGSTSQRSSSPRITSPQRVTSPPPPPPPPPPRRSSSGKGPAKQGNIASKSVGSPTRSASSQRLDSPPRGSTSPQRTISPSPPANVGSSSKPAISPKTASSPKFVHRPRPEPTLRNQHVCATKIQAAYRGYMARRSYRALRGLVRLQAVVKGQSVKRQTVNAMKCMQLLVRVQTQIQSRRIQMLENQARQRQAMYKNDMESGKWSDRGQDEWDDSTLTKEEVNVRMQRKVEAVMKRERAMAYAYSNQLWKVTPRTAQAALMDLRSSGGYPWWWNWLDRQQTPSKTPRKPLESASVSRNFHLTPPRSVLDSRASPLLSQSSNCRSQENIGFDTPTPRSSRSAVPFRNKLAQTPPPGRGPQRFGGRSRPGGSQSPFSHNTFKDDDSLTSCPPFSVPRYMEPTASAKAKLRGDEEQSRRRMSYPLGQGIGSFKWNKRGPLFSAANPTPPPPSNETGSQRLLARKQSLQSIGNLSVDSTISMPATVGRKPFNRFV